MTKITGGCACGAIRYEAEGEPMMSFACHCTDCQHATGGGPSYEIVMPTAGFSITKGTPRVYRQTASSGKGIGRHFCGTCGSLLFAEVEMVPDFRPISAGSLDDKDLYKPAMHMWVSSARPWHHIDPALPKFDKNPE